MSIYAVELVEYATTKQQPEAGADTKTAAIAKSTGRRRAKAGYPSSSNL